jgi:hypothetical protein
MEGARFDETKTDEQERNGSADARIATGNSSITGSRKHIRQAGNAQPRRAIARARSKNRNGAGVAVIRGQLLS